MDEEKKIKVGNLDDFMKLALERRKMAMDAQEDNREAALDDLKKIDGQEQWDEDIRQRREAAKRPVITENLLPAFIDQVVNDQRQQRPQIKCLPVDSKSDPETADIIAGLIRNISYQSQAEQIHDMQFDHTTMAGFGVWKVKSRYEHPRSFNQELEIQNIENPFNVLWDPLSRKFDTSDKKWTMIEEEVGREEFVDMYPKASLVPVEDAKGTGMQDWFLPQKVKRAEYWYIEEKEETLLLLDNGDTVLQSELSGGKLPKGRTKKKERPTTLPKVRSCMISGKEILSGPFEWPGIYIPVVISFGKVMMLEGEKRLKSLIRDGKDTQKLYNYWLSALTEAVALQPDAPYLITTKQLENYKPHWDQANKGGKPYLPYNPDPEAGGPPQRQMPPQIPAGTFQMVIAFKDNLKDIFNIHQAALGMEGNEKSGKAISARQRESDVGTYVFMSNFLAALQFEGRIMSDLIPHYYDTPRSLRIIGKEGPTDIKQVEINKNFDDKKGGKKMYDITTGKYDVVITTGPSFTTQRQETLETMTSLIQAMSPSFPAIGAALITDIVKLLNTPNVESLIEKIKAILPPEIRQVMETEDSEDPAMMNMKMAFEQQIMMLTAQLQEAGASVQQLEQAVEQGKIAIQGKEIEVNQMRSDYELAKREIQLKADQGTATAEIEVKELEERLKTVQERESALNEFKAIINGMDNSLAKFIEMGAEVKETEGENGEKIIALVDPTTAKITKQIEIKKTKDGKYVGTSVQGEGKTGD